MGVEGGADREGGKWEGGVVGRGWEYCRRGRGGDVVLCQGEGGGGVFKTGWGREKDAFGNVWLLMYLVESSQGPADRSGIVSLQGPIEEEGV